MALLESLRDAVRSGGDPIRARAQRAYMKSALPYRGHSSPELRDLVNYHASLAPPSRREAAKHL